MKQRTSQKDVLKSIEKAQYRQSRFGLLKNKKILIPCVVLVVLAVGVLVAGLLRQTKEQETGVCTTQIITKAAPHIKENSTAQMRDQIVEIKKLKGYESDVNCLYIVTKYYVGIGDAANARKSLEGLKRVYKSNKDYNPLLGTNIESPDLIEQRIVFIESLNDNSSFSLEDQVQQ